MLSRRSAASLIAGLPLVGPALAKQAGGASLSTSSYPALNGTSAGSASQGVFGQAPTAPLMPQWQAMRLALRDPDMLALARRVAFERHRVITSVDPDIEVHRSFSPMAKITFQRQRNVEREIEQAASEPIYEWGGGAFRRLVDKLMWGK